VEEGEEVVDLCPFTQQPCPLAKTTHITELKDGVVTELHLCKQCAERYLGDPEMPPPPSSVKIPVKGGEETTPVQPGFVAIPVGAPQGGLLPLLQLLFGGPLALKQNEARAFPPCSHCGIEPKEIVKKGRFGCDKCYQHFNTAVQQSVARCQDGNLKHVGKVPKRWAEEQKKRRLEEEAALDAAEKLRRLKGKLAKAIEVENYEVAAILKKKIEELQPPSSPNPPASEGQ
jgi:protein-arginine kinase activator protein McsA